MSHLSHARLGMTLIEMLLAMSLSLMVLTLLITLYATQQKQAQWLEDLFELEQRTFMLRALLMPEVARAGHIGCPKLSEDLPVKNTSGIVFTSANKLKGSEHAFTVRYKDNRTASLLSYDVLDPRQIISTAMTVTSSDVLIVSDCRHAAIMRIMQAHPLSEGVRLTLSQPLEPSFAKGSEIAKLQVHHFYVATTQRKRRDGSPLTALYMLDSRLRAHEWVPSVTRLTCKYVQLIQGRFELLEAQAVTDWRAVRAVAINAELQVGSLHKTVTLLAWIPV